MDKHLVFLVKQTERYTEMLVTNMGAGGEVGLDIHRVGSLRAHTKSSAPQAKRLRLLDKQAETQKEGGGSGSRTTSPDDVSSSGTGGVYPNDRDLLCICRSVF
jgi:hypothetical protein